MLVNICSQDKNTVLSSSSTDFVILLPIPINNITCVELLSVTLPNTIYKIQSYNNTFYWSTDDGTNQFNIMIPYGAYTIYNLLLYIQNQMNSTDPNNNYTLTYDSTTFKVTISSDNDFNMNFALPNTCCKELGFNNTNTSFNTAITGSNAIQLYQPLSIFIVIKELGGNNFTTSKFQYTFKVPLTVLSSGIIEFDTNSFFKQVVNLNRTVNFNQFNIQLVDNQGRLIDLNGADWELVLKFS
jgi:hypothetical protein